MFDLMLTSDLSVGSLLGKLTYAMAIVVGVFLALRILRLMSRRLAESVLKRNADAPRELQQKAQTLAGILESTGRVIVTLVAVMTMLSVMGLPVAPLLASAGVAGIAVGLAAQSLIRDYLSGFFILWENQFAVGDVIKVGDQAGLVEHLDLRTTRLRNLEGALITIPNGEIRVVSNLTRGWARVTLDVDVAYKEDTDHVTRVLRQTADELAEDEVFGPLILEEPVILGVDKLGEYQVTIKLLIKTQPMKQWDVAREMRARIKKAFEREGIEIPFPHRVHLTRVQSFVDLSEQLASAQKPTRTTAGGAQAFD